jgi:hypothetical protein
MQGIADQGQTVGDPSSDDFYDHEEKSDHDRDPKGFAVDLVVMPVAT